MERAPSLCILTGLTLVLVAPVAITACPWHFGFDGPDGEGHLLPPLFSIQPTSTGDLSADRFMSRSRQITFEGRRAGEGYFSPDGSAMVFQSERVTDNPWFQIFIMDRETGETELISTGIGKTTCAYINPVDSREVMFASTHADPESIALQQAEIELRASGNERRYSWDYDPAFDIYVYDRESSEYRQLTTELGYDAEGCYSSDGKTIVFASNRNAYSAELSEEDRRILETDPASFMDLYLMDADGSNVRQITDEPGYDGGPFFSYDGKFIVWRRFGEHGLTADVFIADSQGGNQRRVTDFGAMSWAPFLHPSNEYIIFTCNKQGFENFELYIVDREGAREPVRVTHTEGFDGLPVFTPDGNSLVWTTNRRGSSQLFQASWDHDAALQAILEAPPRNQL